MTLRYGHVRAKVISVPGLKASRHRNEIQYHLHASMRVGAQTWTSPSMSAPTTPTTFCNIA
jgi:hypothetical protein